jgi:hypothetical protein
MSETGKKILSAAQTVENSLAATVKDMENGIGSFFSGGHARTNEAEAVREQSPARDQEQPASSDTTAGQIVASQDVGGKPHYLVQTENQKGEPEKVLFEKGGTDYQAGADVTVTWGSEGRPASAKVDSGVELSWGGDIAGQSQFTGQSQFASTYHDDSQGL